jgi:uncharacterized peroxidase-related enzyme
MARIEVIDYENATGRLKEIYEALISKRGKLADVHTIQSLRPESIVMHMDLYMEIMFGKSELTRANREMMAVVVSVQNNCEYCQIHHAAALNHYWKDEKKVALLKNDFRQVKLSNKEHRLCEFAKFLTLKPGDSMAVDITIPLRESGFDDKAILDTTLVVAYFNFVNRIIQGLGVRPESESGTKGYIY